MVDEILDSKVTNRKLRYLVKWKDFGIEHNLWEPWDDVHAPDLVAEFYLDCPWAGPEDRGPRSDPDQPYRSGGPGQKLADRPPVKRLVRDLS